MQNRPPPHRADFAVGASTVAITAALYAVGKGATAYIHTPWGVGQLLVGIFLPAFFAVVADTLPVALGAGLGTFIGDVLFLAPLGATTPFLSLVAGVPANFVGILLFGWFVKRYNSWAAFVAGTISFVTLGNLIAAVSVVLFVPLPAQLILGFVVYWNTTSIPAIIIGVPVLVRAVGSRVGRSRILKYSPTWSATVGRRQSLIALAFGLLFVALGAGIILGSPGMVSSWPGLAGYFAIAGAVVVIFGPLANLFAGSKVQATNPEG
jgi:hypothetical protein